MLGPLQVPRQQQTQGQQQQVQQQQQQQQQQQLQQQGDLLPPPQSGQDFTLSSVLHFLQTEWRRYERDRNEWEIERAEMRARIALLEGERRSFENVKLDLMRRIKMLEYALRVERSKQLTQSTSQGVQTTKSGVSHSQKEEKEGSGGSSPRSEDSALPQERIPGGQPNGNPPSNPSSRPHTWAGMQLTNGPHAANLISKPPPGRDPKSRARSREYLKQCLQEVSYLTSPQAMNPLPNRPLLSNPSLPLSLPNVPSFDQIAYNGRPRKAMPDLPKEFPQMMNMGSAPPSVQGSQITALDRNVSQSQQTQQQHSTGHSGSQPQQEQSSQVTQTQPQQQQLPPQLQSQSLERNHDTDIEPRQLTAIFRPDDAGEWKEQLRMSHEAAERERLERTGQPPSLMGGVASWERGGPVDELDGGKDVDEEDEEEATTGFGEGAEADGAKLWKPKRTLRNHLDAIRTIAFHPSELCLASGSDDNTIKLWRMDVATLASSASRSTVEVEPQLTLRGHSAGITKLIHIPSRHALISASLDSSIRIWSLPPPSHTTYAPYDGSRATGELIGHTDAVWDLALVRDDNTLISCGAEGTVKVWEITAAGGILKLSWSYNGLNDHGEEIKVEGDDEDTPGATVVEAVKMDLKKVAVAYQNTTVKIFDIETGKEEMKLQPEIVADEGVSTQINALASHPTMPLLVTGHEDKYIRIFDISTCQCTHSMLAHLDGVTCLSIDPAGFALVSGGHDGSVRFWDILGSKACVQDINVHREKAREGVLAVEFHQSLPFVASAGADGIIKLYSSS
ncbi:WD40 repeat-like protein [Thelephora terrestris]|uniref:WD40 repeat-like protein n=1 Tax=Thelephora terrestris TaxID=56493 RepID=A0A9P6HQL7_9AGAM|nr:WD40 repeat-like protein [Thelephora terrestris]